MAMKAKATCVALARASWARDKLVLAMPAPLRFELFGHATPPIAWPLVWGLAGVLALLTLGALAALILPLVRPGHDYTNLRQRVNSWWVMVALLTIALALGWQTTLALFAVISFIALREFLSLAPAHREDRLIILASYLV